MTVTRPCYANRDTVMRAPDFKFSARNLDAVDRAIESASDTIDWCTGRVFYNTDETRVFDWPNFQRSYSWRLWLDANDLVAVTNFTTGTIVIPPGNYILQPANSGPPYRCVDLRLDKSSAFGNSSTWQQDLALTGTWGFWGRTRPAGFLAAAMADTTTGIAQVTDGSQIGAGDVLILGTERMLVTDKRMVSTGVTWSGLSTAQVKDSALNVPDSTKFNIGEILLVDAERVLIVDIAANTLIVKRGWDGTALDSHTSGTLYAARQLITTRGDFGTTAATHLISAPCVTQLIPPLVRDNAVAEAIVQLTQEPGIYSAGSGQQKEASPGSGLGDLRIKLAGQYSRQARSRAV